jgi:3-hydroxyisobutyrate dehydrogenase-like beta-hydroxyacid dehydrogenase
VTTPKQTIGMIGIGQLGLPIAINLINSGYKVVGYRRTDREAFAACGGDAKDSVADVTRESDVLLLCLPNEKAQLDILEQPEGVLANLKAGQVIIELGTYRREFKLEQARKIQALGGLALEAEVSGSPQMVGERKAALYIGGSKETLDRYSEILDAITAYRFHLGDYGSAVAMKLIANQLLTIHTLAAAEAINLGVSAGFDAHRVAEVIKQGAGNSTMFSIRAPMMASRKFSPAPGPFDTLEKYLDLTGEMATKLGCATPLFSASVPYFRRALEGGMGGEDISAVIKFIEADSALQKLDKFNKDIQ